MNSATTCAAVALLLAPELSRATEKYLIVEDSALIVVGTLHPGNRFLWFDGWHMLGTIAVDEVLYGRRPASQIDFHFVCSDSCRFWRPPRLLRVFTQKGLWFLRPIDLRTWESANGISDIGFRSLSQRADFERYIRRYMR